MPRPLNRQTLQQRTSLTKPLITGAVACSASMARLRQYPRISPRQVVAIRANRCVNRRFPLCDRCNGQNEIAEVINFAQNVMGTDTVIVIILIVLVLMGRI